LYRKVKKGLGTSAVSLTFLGRCGSGINVQGQIEISAELMVWTNFEKRQHNGKP
jgi:hypothetical protein